MSFQSNPYEHVDVVQRDDGRWTWECESCGGEGMGFEQTSQLELLLDDFHMHIQKSHGRTIDDFEGWSR